MKIKSTVYLLGLFVSVCISFLHANAAPLAVEPNTQPDSIRAYTGNCTEIDLAFDHGDGSRRLIVASADVPVSSFPVDGIGYSSSSLFGTGSNLGNNNYVVYSGTTGISTTITGLSGGTQYFFAIFEFNGTGNNSNYLLTGYPTSDAIATGFTIAVSSTSGDMCSGDSVKLEVTGASTYQWSPSATLSSDTDSVVWAKPSGTITYNVQGWDNTGCSDSKNISITVYSSPNVVLPAFSNKCINGGNVTLTSGTPMGGIYSGDGVFGSTFRPDVAGIGSHLITYSYSDIHGCSSFDTSTIRVLNKPNVGFATLDDVCEDANSFPLTGGTPSGGVYSGTGVSSGQFNPGSSGVGHFQIRYIYTDGGGCADTATANQDVLALPNVTFATLQPVCLNLPPFNLSGGSPSGGVYSGNGVTSSQFSPLVTGAGTFTLTYTYTDADGCSSDDTSKVTVNTLPSVGFTPLNAVCQNTGPVTLTGGTPAGGSYSGPTVNAGVFYSGIAGQGQHTIIYSYTNSNQCTNTATQVMTVNAIPHPDLGADISVCAGTFAHLSGGSFTSYYWSTGVTSPSINVDTTGRGIGTFPFILIVANGFGCTNKDTIRVTFDQCNGINDGIIRNDNFSVFPNPSSSGFTVLTEEGSDISLYDLKGSLLFEEKNIPSVFLIGEDLSSGSYFIRVQKNKLSTYKLILKN